MRKHKLTYWISREEADYRRFYHGMYAHYLRDQCGEEVTVEPEARFLPRFQKGELMPIVGDDQIIAAALLHQSEGWLAHVWVGVPEELREDAEWCIQGHVLLYGYSRGCIEIDFLGSRPILNDRLFRYKRKWEPASKTVRSRAAT